eukprot:2222350-Pleurochrysis_carterae.AAC.1
MDVPWKEHVQRRRTHRKGRPRGARSEAHVQRFVSASNARAGMEWQWRASPQMESVRHRMDTSMRSTRSIATIQATCTQLSTRGRDRRGGGINACEVRRFRQ